MGGGGCTVLVRSIVCSCLACGSHSRGECWLGPLAARGPSPPGAGVHSGCHPPCLVTSAAAARLAAEFWENYTGPRIMTNKYVWAAAAVVATLAAVYSSEHRLLGLYLAGNAMAGGCWPQGTELPFRMPVLQSRYNLQPQQVVASPIDLLHTFAPTAPSPQAMCSGASSSPEGAACFHRPAHCTGRPLLAGSGACTNPNARRRPLAARRCSATHCLPAALVLVRRWPPAAACPQPPNCRIQITSLCTPCTLGIGAKRPVLSLLYHSLSSALFEPVRT